MTALSERGAGVSDGPRRQPIAPLRSDFTLRFHSEAQIEPLREATLALLEHTGVKYQSAKALAILKKAGANVDEGSDLVRLPRRLVEEALALDVIDAVGPGGHFLAQPHTRRHLRDALVRAVTQEIDADGQHYRDAVEVARERALDILQHYEPEPLDDDARRELRRIVGDADRELRG